MTIRSTLTEQEQRFVAQQRVARLATADEQGNPYVVPVCFAFDSTHFYIALDEKPKSVPQQKLRRVRNIEARPQISLLFDQYDDDWSQLGYVLIQAQAQIITPTHEVHAPALLLLRQRYQQYRTMALERYPMILITPERITTWGPALS